MATIDELKILVTAEVAKAVSDLDKTEKQTNKTSSAFAKLRDFMQGPVAAGKQVVQIFQQIKAVSDKMEAAFAVQEQSVAILNSTLKATGGAAGFTSEEIQSMASEFQSMTKYGDETTISMQNVLLGFKNIKGDNFKDASLQILNMATVMNMDLTSAAQAVGKALDDPIKGVDSLSRQGFRFSDQQKELMKTLVESGKIEEAQGIILDELATTYGGAAEAAGNTSTAIKVKLSNAIGDVNEEIGRSISNNLKPWREKWLQIAQAIGASAKAQNDFQEAMNRDSMGVATLSDKLIIAEDALNQLKKSSGGLASEEIYGSKSQIEAQSLVIAGIKEQIRIAKLYGDFSAGRGEQEKKNSEQAVKDAESRATASRIAGEAAKIAYENEQAAREASDISAKSAADTYGDWLVKMHQLNGEIEELSKPIPDPDPNGEWKTFIEDALKGLEDISEGYGYIDDAVSSLMDLQSNQSDAEIAAMERERDAMEANGEDITAIEKDIAEKKNEQAKKEFNSKKLTGIAEALINGSIAFTKALPNYILAGIVAASTAVQVGSIGAQQYVPMATGGYVDSPTHILAGEAGGEWVLNRQQMAGLAKNGIQGNGGTTIVQNISGSIWNTKQLESMAISAQAKASRGF